MCQESGKVCTKNVKLKWIYMKSDHIDNLRIFVELKYDYNKKQGYDVKFHDTKSLHEQDKIQSKGTALLLLFSLLKSQWLCIVLSHDKGPCKTYRRSGIGAKCHGTNFLWLYFMRHLLFHSHNTWDTNFSLI